MSKLTALVCAVALGGQAVAQVTLPVPSPSPGSTRPQGGGYGSAVPVELESIAFDAETHQRKHVLTQGRLDILEPNQYYLLRNGAARVLVLLSHGMGHNDVLTLLGRDAEVRGIVRRIRPKEYPGGTDLDLIEDPDLPVLPAPRSDWPKVSLTLLSVAAIESSEFRSKTGADRGEARQILANPPLPATAKDVRLAGLFRGRNLFGELPAASQRLPQDWVVKDGDTAFWVTGKEPRGKGWSLDPTYRPDTTRWVEVVGKPEVANGVLYVRASRVSLIKRPSTGEDEPQ